MPVTVLDSTLAFRIPLATPADVDPMTGEVLVTPANLGASGGAGEFTDLAVSGDAQVSGTLQVDGAVTFNGTLAATSGPTSLRSVAVSQGATVGTTLGVTGNVTAGADVAVTGAVSCDDLTATGVITAPNLQVFADNAAALLGGLTPGVMYRTATGQAMVVFTP